MAEKQKPARVANIPTSHIERNPHNPRRLFDEGPMRTLQESIKKLGILVPLDVYPKDSRRTSPRRDQFVLLDGERRWRCAKELGLRALPAIVVEKPTETRNILTMFHIHNVREGWQLMPTALKLQDLMRMMKERNERKLAELTKLNISTIRRCRVLLTYPKKYQLMMLAPPSERYKADFFIDLQRFRKPALEDKLPPWLKRGDTRSIDAMMAKYDSEVIKSVTEFRELAAIYRGAQKSGQVPKFLTELERFLSNPEMRIPDIDVPGASFAKEAREIRRSYRRLYGQLKDVDFENLATDAPLIDGLTDLANLILQKLEKALLIRRKHAD